MVREMNVRTFAEALRAVSAAASQELPAVLEIVARQAEALLGCDGVGIDLAEGFGDALLFRRARIPAFAAARGAGDLPTWRPPSAQRAQLEAGEVVWQGDYQAVVEPGTVAERPWLRDAGARLAAPMLSAPVGGPPELIGVLTAIWREPRGDDAEMLQVAEALGLAAAVAVQTSRLIQSERALVEAARAVTSPIVRDLDAVLDALVAQAAQLLRTDGVTLHLVDPLSREFVRRRISQVAHGERAQPGTRFTPGPLGQEAMASGRPVFAAEFQHDPRVPAEARAELPTVQSSMALPLIVDGEVVGGLFAHWTQPHRMSAWELDVADAFGRQAALAVRNARLLEERERARRELAAVLESATDAISVFRADGRLVHANPVARERYVQHMGEVPATVQEYVARARPTGPGDAPIARSPGQRALAGETAEEVFEYVDLAGRRVRYHVQAAPVLAPDGAVQAAVVVGRDITALQDAISERARLDGAVKTARLVAHELNTKLAIVVGNADMLRERLNGEERDQAEDVMYGAEEAARIVARLQRLIRFEETQLAGIAMLDLEAATQGRP
jgi:GAF domain-containing protein